MGDTSTGSVRHPSSSAFAVDRMVMRRGAALQTLVTLAERNTLTASLKRFAFSRLRSHAFGEESQSNASDDPGTLRFSRSQLRLLRQEQLMLMSENERLVYELQEIRRNRPTSAFRPNKPLAVPEFRESKLAKAIDLTLSGERDLRFNTTRIALLCGLISRLRLKVLSAVMRVLARQPIKSLAFGGPRAFTAGQPNIRQVTVACLIMETVIRSKVDRVKHTVLRILMHPATGRFRRRLSNEYSEAAAPCNDQRRPVDVTRLYLPGPHSSYQRQLPSVRRYLC